LTSRYVIGKQQKYFVNTSTHFLTSKNYFIVITFLLYLLAVNNKRIMWGGNLCKATQSPFNHITFPFDKNQEKKLNRVGRGVG
jgi:hypothetical protein